MTLGTPSSARTPPPTDRVARTTGWWFTLAACIPVAWLLAFAWLVLRARAVTGDWPSPYRPDPQEIGGLAAMAISGTLPLIYFMGLMAGGGALIMWAVPAVRIFAREARPRAWQVYMGVAAMMLIAILLHGNPWQLRTWLAD